MSLEGPFGQFRHRHREFLLFVFLGLLKRRKTRFAKKWGTPPRLFLDLTEFGLHFWIGARDILSQDTFSGEKM